MSRFFRSRLVSLGAALLFSSAVFAQNSRDLPEQAAAPDVPLNRTLIAYDSSYHLFPVETRLPLYDFDSRFVTRTSWDGACQAPLEETDINGRVRTTQYDALCRPIRVDEPYDGAQTKFT